MSKLFKTVILKSITIDDKCVTLIKKTSIHDESQQSFWISVSGESHESVSYMEDEANIYYDMVIDEIKSDKRN